MNVNDAVDLSKADSTMAIVVTLIESLTERSEAMLTELLRINVLGCRHCDEVPKRITDFFSCYLGLRFQELIAINFLKCSEQSPNLAEKTERKLAGATRNLGKAVRLASIHRT
jgi:hypothetical protein